MESSELQEYKDAVWDFLMEHSDILEGGAIFVKFHVSHRANFERRIRARSKYDYHRIDDRTGEDNEAKEARATKQREERIARKKAKHEAWKADKEERRRVFEALKRENEGRKKWGRFWPWVKRIQGVCKVIHIDKARK